MEDYVCTNCCAIRPFPISGPSRPFCILCGEAMKPLYNSGKPVDCYEFMAQGHGMQRPHKRMPKRAAA